MCISDWQIGRFIRSVSTQHVDANAAPVVLPANRQRVAVMFVFDAAAIAATGRYEVVVGGAHVIDSQLFALPTIFTLKDHGDLPTKRFSVTGTVSPAPLGITEWFLPEDVLDSFVSKLKLGSNA